MFAHDVRASASDLSYWLGPLSPAFSAMTGPRAEAALAPEPEGSGSATAAPTANQPGADAVAQLRTLFHTLNNQLGVILTFAELLEAKAPDEKTRARATQIVSATIDALGTSKEIRIAVVK
jgi:hypothetical protein